MVRSTQSRYGSRSATNATGSDFGIGPLEDDLPLLSGSELAEMPEDAGYRGQLAGAMEAV